MNIKELKYRRLKPEEKFLVDILLNLTEYKSNKYNNYIFYMNDDEVLFRYNLINGNFAVHYGKVWSILQSKFNIKYVEIYILIKCMVEKHLKLNDITLHQGLIVYPSTSELNNNIHND